MMRGSRTRLIPGLVLIAAAGAVGLGSRAYPDTKAVFESAVDETMAVRFYYDRGSDYYHFPLVLRATGAGDPRLDTIAPGDEGRTAYISAAEVQRLLQELAGSDLGWRESEKVQRLESFKQLVYHGRATQSMEVLVVCSKETVSGQIRPKKICDTLKPLDSALKRPHALWEFQAFRQGYGCKVPGFNPDTYPYY